MRSGTPSRVWVLTGMGGSGKTTVALAFAQKARTAGYETWWISAATTTDLWGGARQVAISLGGTESDIDRAWAGVQSAPDLLWRLLGRFHHRWLLVIDNADDPDLLAAPNASLAMGTGWLRPLRSRKGLILVTSRIGDPATWGSWCNLRYVAALQSVDGAQVLIDQAGLAAGTRMEAESLATRLGGLPLALRLAGGFLRDVTGSPWPGPPKTFSEYEAALDSGRVNPMSQDGNQADSFSSAAAQRSWDMSLDLLDRRGMSKARPLLTLLSFLADADIPYQIMLNPDVMGTSPLFNGIDGVELWRFISGLTQLNLIERRHTDGSATEMLRIHPIVRVASVGKVQAGQEGGFLALAAALLDHAVDQRHQRQDKAEAVVTNDLWRTLAPHASDVLDKLLNTMTAADEALTQCARAAHRIANQLNRQGLVGEAEQLYRAVLNARQRSLTEDALPTLAARHDLARVLDDRGIHKTAETELRAVLRACQRILGGNHLSTAAAHHSLGRALHHQGQYAAAESEYRAALSIRCAILGEENRLTLGTRHQLARVLHNLGQLAEAEAVARDVYVTEVRVLGSEHPDTLITRHQLAVILQGLGRYHLAEAEYRAVYDIQARTLGEDHPDTLTTRHNILRVQMNHGPLESQLAGYDGLISHRRQVLGDEHPATLTSMNNHAVVLHSAGRLSEAEQLARLVYATNLRIYGEEHPNSLSPADTLASILHDRGQLAEAEDRYRRLILIAVRILGDHHEFTLILRHQLVGTFLSQGRLDTAEDGYREVLDDQLRWLGAESIDALASRHSLARVLYVQKKYAEMVEQLDVVIAARRRITGLDQPTTALSPCADRALAIARLGDFTQAEAEIHRVVKLQTSLLGKHHPQTIASRTNLAEILAIGGQHRQSRVTARRVWRDANTVFGEDYPFSRFIRIVAQSPGYDWSTTSSPRPTCYSSDVFSSAVSEVNMPQHRHIDEWSE